MSAAQGRPKQARVPSGDRPRLAAGEGLTSNAAQGRPKQARVPSGDQPRLAAGEGPA